MDFRNEKKNIWNSIGLLVFINWNCSRLRYIFLSWFRLLETITGLTYPGLCSDLGNLFLRSNWEEERKFCLNTAPTKMFYNFDHLLSGWICLLNILFQKPPSIRFATVGITCTAYWRKILVRTQPCSNLYFILAKKK